MRITIHSTARLTEIQSPDGCWKVPARVWEGKTDGGIKVICLVTRVAARSDQNLAQFEAELGMTHAPASVEARDVFPLKMVI